MYVHPLVLFSAVIWAIMRGSDCVSGEIGRGTMEMLLAQPVRRTSLYTAHSARDDSRQCDSGDRRVVRHSDWAVRLRSTQTYRPRCTFRQRSICCAHGLLRRRDCFRIGVG